MVRGDEERVSVLHTGVVDGLDGGVGGGDGLDGGFVDTGVSDHVGWGKVVHEELVLAFGDAGGELVGDGLGGHFGLEVVGGNFGGGDEVALFVFELLLDTAVANMVRVETEGIDIRGLQEEGDVGVFLGLGDVDLLDALLCEGLGQNVVHGLGWEGNWKLELEVVLGHGGDVEVLWEWELWKWGGVVAEELGDFTDSVGSVVEEEEGIVVCDMLVGGISETTGKRTLDSGFITVDDNWLQELVGLALLISLSDERNWIGSLLSLTEHDAIKSNVDSLPSLVSVHSIISSNNSSNLSNTKLLRLLDQLLQMPSTALWVGITSISEKVDINLLDAMYLCCLQQGNQVRQLGMDTTIRDQSKKVESSIPLLDLIESRNDVWNLWDLSVTHELVNPDNILPDDTARTNVEMTDLRVTHETLGEPDGFGRGLEFGEALFVGGEGIHGGGVGSGNGVSLADRLRRNPPSVNHLFCCQSCSQ